MVSLSDIEAALLKRRGYIEKNMEDLTAKKARYLLAKDMGLASEKDLDGFKEEVKAMLDKMLKSIMLDAPEHEVNAPSTSRQGHKRARTEADGKTKKKNGGAGKTAGKTSAVQDDPRVAKLKRMCAQAGIAIAPSVYQHSDRLQAFTELLAKNGLSATSSVSEVEQVKEKIQMQKDLDGIDTSNIVAGGRRRRTAAAPPAPASSQPRKRSANNTGGNSAADSEDDFGASSTSASSRDADSGSGGESGAGDASE